MSSSPTQRTLAWARAQGWTPQVVEKWVPQARRRVDLFGCIDIIALDGLPGSLGLQASSTSNMAARLTKAKDEPALRKWLAAGNRFWVIGWALRGARGKRKTWTARIVALRLGVTGFQEIAVNHDDDN